MVTPGSFGWEIYHGTIYGLNSFMDAAGIQKTSDDTHEDNLQLRLNEFYNNYIRMKREEDIRNRPRVVRGLDRRGWRSIGPGHDVLLIGNLEQAARFRSLSEDDRECLAQAQARQRKDGTANGFRKGFDRREN